MFNPPDFYPSNFWVTPHVNCSASCTKRRQQRYFLFFSPGNFECFAGFQHRHFLPALWSSCIKAITGVPFSAFFCLLVVSPSQQRRSELWAAQLVFSQVCWAGVQSPREQTRREQTRGERSRDNIALFSCCIPRPSHSSQEMLSLLLVPLHVSCQIFSLWLNPALEV